MPKQKPDIIKRVETCLREWSEFYLRNGETGIGFPPVSIEFSARNPGAMRVSVIEYDTEYELQCQRIGLAVAELGRHDLTLHKVVKVQYCERGVDAPEKARRVRMSQRNFYRCLDRAHWWLAARLF